MLLSYFELPLRLRHLCILQMRVDSMSAVPLSGTSVVHHDLMPSEAVGDGRDSDSARLAAACAADDRVGGANCFQGLRTAT